MASSLCIPMNYSPSQNQLLRSALNGNNHLLHLSTKSKSSSSASNGGRRYAFTTKALLSSSREAVLKDFHERRALKVLLQSCILGVGSAVNKLNDVLAMIAEVRSIANSLGVSTKKVEMADERNSASRAI